MLLNQQVVNNFLNFTDQQYFEDIVEILFERELLLLDENYFGIALNAPSLIDTSLHDQLPIVFASKFNSKRDRLFNLADQCILVGINIQSSLVVHGHMFRRLDVKKRRLESSGADDNSYILPDNEPEGVMAQLAKIDAKEKLGINWNTGVWFFTAINFDWISNSVKVVLNGDAKLSQTEPESIFPKPTLEDSILLPSFFPAKGANELKEKGIKFKVKPLVSNNKASISLSVTFNMPMESFYKPKKEIIHNYRDRGQEKVLAIIPLSLIIIPNSSKDPFQFDWQVPIYKMNSGGLIEGHLSINVLEGYDLEDAKGSYACYVVLSSSILGPQILEISNS
ncbi:MAG: hypothetical protein L3J51_13395 [Cocleimonas sp.]|nr:hypothetical protein [Cocleimonas sp.]